MPDHTKWANAQVAAAIALGINPLDAANAVRAFLDMLPDGADPDTYVVPAAQLEQDITRDDIKADAVAAWIGDDAIPTRFKLLLLVGEE